MKILIIGAGKSGTTAFTYGIKEKLPNHEVIFEPSSLSEIKDDSNNLIVKFLNISQWQQEKQYFEKFERKILIVRHPFDRIISYLLYAPHNGNGFSNDRNTAEYIKLLQQKTEKPSSVSLMQIINLFKKITGIEVMPVIEKLQNHILEFYLHNKNEFKLLKYEDFIDRKMPEIESYLGINMENEIQVAPKHKRVERSKQYGDWKKWFTDEDIEKLSVLFKKFNEAFNYETKFRLESDDVELIKPEHSYLYAISVINEYRGVHGLPEYQENKVNIGEEGVIIDEAIDYMRKKKLVKAEAVISRAIKKNPKIPGTYLIKARILMRRDNLKEAAISILRAIEINPDLESAYEQLWRVLARKRRLENKQLSENKN